ncbi:MAG TPA: hypothetical protein VLL98_00630 [Rickettsiales bacterium]|nr:hypothetical protein [Rickettsiales bacterium]
MFEIIKNKDYILEIKTRLLKCSNKIEIETILLELIDTIKRHNINFLRDKSLYPVFWTNEIKTLDKKYTDTLTSPAMIFCRSLLEDVAIINKNKDAFWFGIYQGTLDQGKNNDFTVIASELYSQYIMLNFTLFDKVVILDNNAICKIEHILVRDELPLLVDAYQKYQQYGSKTIPNFLTKSITITSRSLLPNPDIVVYNSDKDNYVSTDILISKLSPKYSKLELRLMLREKDKQLVLREEKLAELEKRDPKYKINSWYAKVKLMSKSCISI